VPPQQLVQLAEPRDAVHERSNLSAKRCSHVFDGGGRVVDHVVQQRRRNGGDRAGRGRRNQAGHDARSLHGVGDVRLTRASHLACVSSRRKLGGAHNLGAPLARERLERVERPLGRAPSGATGWGSP
jgi:hypothetical protein